MAQPILVQEARQRSKLTQSARGGAPLDPAFALKEEQIRLREEGRRKSESLQRAREVTLREEQLAETARANQEREKTNRLQIQAQKEATDARIIETRKARKAQEKSFVETLFFGK